MNYNKLLYEYVQPKRRWTNNKETYLTGADKRSRWWKHEAYGCSNNPATTFNIRHAHICNRNLQQKLGNTLSCFSNIHGRYCNEIEDKQQHLWNAFNNNLIAKKTPLNIGINATVYGCNENTTTTTTTKLDKRQRKSNRLPFIPFVSQQKTLQTQPGSLEKAFTKSVKETSAPMQHHEKTGKVRLEKKNEELQTLPKISTVKEYITHHQQHTIQKKKPEFHRKEENGLPKTYHMESETPTQEKYTLPKTKLKKHGTLRQHEKITKLPKLQKPFSTVKDYTVLQRFKMRDDGDTEGRQKYWKRGSFMEHQQQNYVDLLRFGGKNKKLETVILTTRNTKL